MSSRTVILVDIESYLGAF